MLMYRNQFIIAFVLKFIFVHFRQKILEIAKHYKTNFNIYIYIYIYIYQILLFYGVRAIKSFNKQTQKIQHYSYIYIYIWKIQHVINSNLILLWCQSHKKLQPSIIFFFLFSFSIMVEPQNSPIIINVFPLYKMSNIFHHLNHHFCQKHNDQDQNDLCNTFPLVS